MNATPKVGTSNGVLPFDEIELLRREVEARFGRHRIDSWTHRSGARTGSPWSSGQRKSEELTPTP